MFSTGQEQTIEVPGGKTYRLRRLTVGALRKWFDWVAAQAGDPFATVERFLGRIPDEALKEEFKAACSVRDDLRFPSLATDTHRRALGTEAGACALVRQILDGAYTDDDVLDLLVHLAGSGGLASVLLRAQGGSIGPSGSEGNAAPTPASAGGT